MLDIKAASRDLQEKARDKYYKAIYYIYIYSTCSNKHRKKTTKIIPYLTRGMTQNFKTHSQLSFASLIHKFC